MNWKRIKRISLIVGGKVSPSTPGTTRQAEVFESLKEHHVRKYKSSLLLNTSPTRTFLLSDLSPDHLPAQIKHCRHRGESRSLQSPGLLGSVSQSKLFKWVV